MSKPLANLRHERMAQGLAAGLSQVDAHEEAGYERDRGNAAHVTADHSGNGIKERASDLVEKVLTAANLTAEDAVAMVIGEAKGCKTDGARVRAQELLLKVTGAVGDDLKKDDRLTRADLVAQMVLLKGLLGKG